MLKPLGLGVVTVLVGVLMQALAGFALDERIGLDVLFLQRGQLPPPPEVVLVAIDKTSSDYFGLPNSPDQWPRSLHAKLIDRLSEAGARVIVFDLFFKAPHDVAEDRALAQAMARAGNVLVVGFLKRELVSDDEAAAYFNIERLIMPVPAIEDAAVAVAPFPLPKVPAKVSGFHTVRASAGDMFTLPALALQFYALGAYDELIEAMKAAGADVGGLPAQADVIPGEAGLVDVASRLSVLIERYPQVIDGLLGPSAGQGQGDSVDLLRAMVELHRGDRLRYLNFYGPPRSIATLPYWRVAAGDELPDLTGKAVFVGFSELLQPEQRDGFYTAFSQQSGLDISGVEIAATAFANLLRDESIRMPWHLGVIMVFGVLIVVCASWSSSAWGIVTAGVAFCAAYVGLSFHVFHAWQLWLPLFVPVVIQTPLVMLMALLWRYLQANRERKRIRRAFGYYLPASAVEQLVKDAGRVRAGAQRMYGVVLATDAEQYTRLSESMAPEALSEMLNRYYGVLFAPVRQRGGVVSDVIGDAMLAMWSSVQPVAQHRFEACAAALEIIRGVKQNRLSSCTPTALPTRIGLHAGDVMIGNVGAIDHFEYRAVGDIVNTSTRIEGLNKQLGTRIIASRQVVEGIEDIVTRPLGAFRLVGKQRPLDLFEIVCLHDDLDAATAELLDGFAAGLEAYGAQMWDDAAQRFAQLLRLHPEDGPSGFYRELCLSLLESPPPESWNPTVVVKKK